MRIARLTLMAVFAALLPLTTQGADKPARDPHDRSNVPIEVQPTDAKLAKIVLIAGDSVGHGADEHEHFAGCALFYRMLKQTPGVAPVMVQNGWPTNPDTLKDAKAIVFYMDGGGKQSTATHAAEVQKLVDAGVGIVHLHQIIDYSKAPADQARKWLGGVFTGNPPVARGHWNETWSQFPEHPICRGVAPFTVAGEGFLLRLSFVPDLKGVTPILRTHLLDPKGKPVDPATVGTANIAAWTYDRPDGGRSFVYVGGHFHHLWGEVGLRRLVVNAILWTAKVDVPQAGAAVELDPAELMTNLETRPPKAPKK